MIATARIYEPADYPIVQGWWIGHGWPPVPEQMLPKLGLIISSDDADLAAGWLYMDNSVGVCMLEWVVSNPDARPFDSVRAIRELGMLMEQEARRMGYWVMMTSCKQPALAKLWVKMGYLETDGSMIHLMKGLNI